jgi:hypothetical protein
VLEFDFFRDFESKYNFCSIRPGKRAGDPTVNDLRAIRYIGSEVQYKLRHSDEYVTLPQRRPTGATKQKSVISTQLHSSNLPIGEQ